MVYNVFYFFFVLSWLALQAQLTQEGKGVGSDSSGGLMHSANAGTRILWCHGGADNMVEPACQSVGVAALQELGVPVASHTYAGLAHTSSPDEVQEVGKFLAAVITQQQ